jgi:hypothetical protein
VTSGRISQNPYLEYTKLAYKSTARLDLVWENCKHELIYPGMPCKYVYYEGDDLVQLEGVVLHVHVMISLSGNISTSYKHATSASLTLAVKPNPKKPKKVFGETLGKF